MSVLTLESLAKRVAELEREVKLARGEAAGSLNVSANQQGPLPGWLTAGQFGPGVMAKSSLHIKNDGGARAGSSPRMSITDPNGVVRAEAGFLAANGNSPQQWGFRASSAAGTPIFDSLGLIAVMSQLANGFQSTLQNIVAGGSNVVLTNTAISFSLARQSSVLFFYGGTVSAGCTGDAGNDGIDLWVDGVAKSSGGNGPALTLFFPCTTTGGTTSSAVYSFSLAAGAHTANLRASCPGTNGLAVLQAVCAAYLLGT